MTAQTVFVVDDEEAVCESLRWLLESVGLNVETFGSAEAFLRRFADGLPGCVVLDVRMPGMSGAELMDHLADRQIRTPIIFLSAHGDVPLAVRAMKRGAVDFLEKPHNNQQFLECVQHALQRDATERGRQQRTGAFEHSLRQLTPREREILDHVVQGHSNKLIGATLGISSRTVEAHRARLMHKLRVSSLAELLQLALAAGFPVKRSADARDVAG